jgi:hypothetical protein
MSSEAVQQIVETIEDEVNSTPSSVEFEMAYQARVAIDRIRFAIKHTEHFAPRSDQMREAGMQLLDALQRLETVDRRFQVRSRNLESRFSALIAHEPVNGHGGRPSHERTAGSAHGASRGGNSK